jgi:hypothetical protein
MYILQNKENTLEVDEYFVKNSGTISNMLTDLDDWNSNEPIPLPIDFLYLEKYYLFYREVKDIMYEGKKIMEYLKENLIEYIEKYPKQNINPPFYDKILELYRKLSIEDITEYIKIADFLDMLGLTRIISLIYALHIKNIEDYDKKLEIYKKMRKRLGHIN